MVRSVRACLEWLMRLTSVGGNSYMAPDMVGRFSSYEAVRAERCLNA